MGHIDGRYTAVYGYTARVHGRVRAVHTARVHVCVRVAYTAVLGRVHSAYTAVYTAGVCTVGVHVYPCTWP